MPTDIQEVQPKSAFEAVQLEMQGAITVPDDQTPSQELAVIPDAPVVDPQRGDPKPGPDSLPAVPEGDGATDPADNAPQPATPKPDEKKTEVPTPKEADDPAVEVPGKDGGGPTKRPSDEFGELPADAPARTKERFDTMKTRYDEVVERAAGAEEREQRWVQTVKSTGCTPEQFGNVLQHMADMNSGTVEGKLRAYDTMITAVNVMAKELGKPGFGYDPLDAPENADLKEKVEDDRLDPDAARELAANRARNTVAAKLGEQQQGQQAEQQRADAALQAVSQYGASKRATDPLYAAKQAAIRPIIERVIARLPPEEWLDATREAYENAVVSAPAPVVADVPDIKTGMRPNGGPGGAPAKEPASAEEAMRQGMGW